MTPHTVLLILLMTTAGNAGRFLPTSFSTYRTRDPAPFDLILSGKYRTLLEYLDGKNKTPMRMLWEAMAYFRLGRYDRATPLLKVSADRFPALSKVLAQYTVRSIIRSGNRAQARTAVSSPFAKRIRGNPLLMAQLAGAAGQATRAAKLYHAAVRASSMYSRAELAEASLSIARLWHSLKKPYRKIRPYLMYPWYATPVSTYSRQAQTLMRSWYRRSIRKEANCSEWAQRLARLQALNLHRHVWKEVGLLRRKRCPARLRCELEYRLGRSRFYLKRSRKEMKRTARILRRAVRLCEHHPDADLRVKVKYMAGKACQRAGWLNWASSYFRRVIREHPHHSYADDAMLRLAATYTSRGLVKKARRMLRRAAKAGGDRALDAAWMLVKEDTLLTHRWRFVRRELKSMLPHLKPVPPFEDWARLLYWTAMACRNLGMNAEAMVFLERTVKEAPGTFYSFLALQRLDGMSPGSGGRLLGRLLASTTPTTTPWPVLKSSRFADSYFAAFLELSRLGLPNEAWQHLISRRPFRRKDVLKAPDFWRGVAYVMDMLGRYDISHRIVGRILYDHLKGWPAGPRKALWRMAYPRAFESVVERESRLAGIPSRLVWAIMREESGFTPTIRSWAGALGLCQLMPATAHHSAKRAGIKVPSEKELLDPDTNIRIATRHLKELWDEFHGHPALVAAAYNAGRGAVRRWLKRRGDMELDAFVEAIPYSETRGYVKRVVSSYQIYSMLYGSGNIPAIRMVLNGKSRAGSRASDTSGSSSGRKTNQDSHSSSQNNTPSAVPAPQTGH